MRNEITPHDPSMVPEPELPAPPLRRFRSTVPYYARYRLAYPERLIDRVAALTGLCPGDRVLDLGCGPGPLALAFARRRAAVLAMDPEPEMLAACRAGAKAAGLDLEFLEGSAADLPGQIGRLKLVTMGRSFHWMDRAQVLSTLNAMVEPEGAVVLFGEDHPDSSENAWRRIIFETGQRFGLEAPRYVAARREARGRSHESVLLDSCFCDLASVGEYVRHEVSTEDILGRVLSLSIFSPERLGAQRTAFEAALREALLAHTASGRFIELAALTALVARRPAVR